ncbi:hypothetical protein DPMN_168293 [Dreissena polymorpha]|uniref:Uncharacterized protein n=1 Tax=Dreissena polymorpha TaxID=45954 RepID=A0A9D4IZI6_DREPO|nr:hypothetical protein DPMN_168293 [Dreissena polymorpha]
MIFNAVTLFPGAAPVEAGQQPGRVLVNPDWLRFIPVKSRKSPGCRRSCPGESRQRPGIAPVVAGSAPVSSDESRQHPGRAPVYRNTAGTHRVYTDIRPRQSYGNAPVLQRLPDVVFLLSPFMI